MKNHVPALVSLLAFSFGAFGCVGQAGDTVSGKATFVKPATDSTGKQDPSAKPVPPQQSADDFKLEVTIDANGAFQAASGLVCSITSGSMSAQSQSSGSVDSQGGYSSVYSDSTASMSFSNPVCGALKNVNVQALTSFSVVATIPANSANCSAYCEAQAESSCQASPNEASCIASAKASCQASCSGSTKIVGHGQASASALAQLNSEWKSSAAANASVDLVFDSTSK